MSHDIYIVSVCFEVYYKFLFVLFLHILPPIFRFNAEHLKHFIHKKQSYEKFSKLLADQHEQCGRAD